MAILTKDQLLKRFVFLTLSFLLCSCSGTNSPLSFSDKPEDENAIFIAKLELSPAISENWEKASDKDDTFNSFAALISPKDAPQNLDDDQLDEYTWDNIEANKFFAFEAPAGKPIEIRKIVFESNHKAFWLSNTEHFYYTKLSNPKFEITKIPNSGKIYYLGTIKITLKDTKSFADDEGKIDYDEWHFAVPESVSIADESLKAQKWLDENFEKVKGKIETAKMTAVDSGEDNEYLHQYITYSH